MVHTNLGYSYDARIRVGLDGKQVLANSSGHVEDDVVGLQSCADKVAVHTDQVN